MMTPEQKQIVAALIAAAKPFTSGDVVDETSGTIPLMEELRKAIEAAERELEAT
jgi:hypothetical protein